MLPFFEGLEKIHRGIAVYYSTFHDAQGIRAALRADLLQAREPRQVLYIGSHGSRGNVGGVRLDVLRRIMDEYKDQMKRVEGIIISSCEVFQSPQDLLKLIEPTNLRWAVSYSCSIGWFDSLVIELALLNALAEEPTPAYRLSQGRLKEFFQQAFCLINSTHQFEWNGKGTIAEHLLIAIKARANAIPFLLQPFE
ncbi:hypothetical protein ACW9KT_19485 [Hymenobacter sp. HD11105]